MASQAIGPQVRAGPVYAREERLTVPLTSFLGTIAALVVIPILASWPSPPSRHRPGAP